MNIQSNINSALGLAAFLVGQTPMAESHKASAAKRKRVDELKSHLTQAPDQYEQAIERFAEAYGTKQSKATTLEEEQQIEDTMSQMPEYAQTALIEETALKHAKELYGLEPSVESANYLTEWTKASQETAKERQAAIDKPKERLTKEAEARKKAEEALAADQARQAESQRIRNLILERGKE